MKRLTILVVAAATALCAACGSTAYNYPEPQPVIRSAILQAARKHHVSYRLLKHRAWCESRYNPRAVNPTAVGRYHEHAKGLFQFLPSTFRSTPYRNRDIFSARWNALAAAWMQRVGRGSEWACQ